ncbi:hypothetical protein P171DRAFT_166540 [Karstenula rhodostoma CBS 690.94]|uniref:Secreted protein n=1 Tax=Karstenula rhodostoma CBS 690.94 TaxID=1392251 RepID=A0A9P4P7N9_9PLEO|nr:hypothetical protein P171DRAFT_166540 [Karstenula rhodostoma CBS 690.94]
MLLRLSASLLASMHQQGAIGCTVRSVFRAHLRVTLGLHLAGYSSPDSCLVPCDVSFSFTNISFQA